MRRAIGRWRAVAGPSGHNFEWVDITLDATDDANAAFGDQVDIKVTVRRGGVTSSALDSTSQLDSASALGTYNLGSVTGYFSSGTVERSTTAGEIDYLHDVLKFTPDVSLGLAASESVIFAREPPRPRLIAGPYQSPSPTATGVDLPAPPRTNALWWWFTLRQGSTTKRAVAEYRRSSTFPANLHVIYNEGITFTTVPYISAGGVWQLTAHLASGSNYVWTVVYQEQS